MAIMRSRKVEPGWLVTRTLIQSDTTVVPPVTAERSPPLSRMTGADSPVMAASLTLATPAMISPSAGITSPASTSTTSPTPSWCAGVGIQLPVEGSISSLALVVTREARRLSAAALPRPSATLSARLANRTVAQSQTAIWIGKPAGWPPAMATAAETVARAATTSVARMTGLPVSLRGSSLRNASLRALRRTGPERPAAPMAPRVLAPEVAASKVDMSGVLEDQLSAPPPAPGSARRSDPARVRGRIAGRPGSG